MTGLSFKVLDDRQSEDTGSTDSHYSPPEIDMNYLPQEGANSRTTQHENDHIPEFYTQDGHDNATNGSQPENGRGDLEDSAWGVRELARQYTLQSTDSHVVTNPFEAEPGSIIDPNSDNFEPKAYIKALFNLHQATDGVMNRTAGVAFRNLSAYGYGTTTDYQKNVGTILMQVVRGVKSLLGMGGQRRVDILQNFDGLLQAGEMLIVLGPPGSGCSTFLKTIAGQTYGYKVSEDSSINYQGIGFQQMHTDFRGESIYTAEQDVHFPILTVGDTLYFAARTRVPRKIPGAVSKDTFAKHLRDVAMATFGIRHTVNTKVGNDFIRGVSGGERKRVSIAEAALSCAPLQCWDNSTRGLDSANAVEFCKTLRLQADVFNITPAVAIYQAPQAAYNLFDKAIVLYEGREIYFGRADEAKAYFVKMGFHCPERQTTADFLTSMTSPHERIIRPGFEGKAPRSCDEFEAAWKNSPEYRALLSEISQFEEEHPIDSRDLEKFQQSRRLQQSIFQSVHSPYTLSYVEQVTLCLWRGFRRLEADPSLTLTQLFGNFIMALIVGSVFYDLDETTNSFFSRGTLLFFALVMNALSSLLEILTLYAQRGIIEKHKRFALYRPSAEAIASMLTDMPYKMLNTITLNTTLYFMANLRREPGAFFFFLFVMFLLTLVMSGLFRTIASVTRSLEQALAPGSVFVIGIIVYTGFVIPPNYMLGWSRWIKYINPLGYGFESLMVNEFSGRYFLCSPTQLTPIYGDIANSICSVVGSVQGETFVNGDNYINSSYEYYAGHRWRNVGILWAFLIGLTGAYLLATEIISSKKSKGEVLVFQRGHIPLWAKNTSEDAEAARTGVSTPTEKEIEGRGLSAAIKRQTSIFQWHDVCYDIKIKGQPRRILDKVDGWVKPGTLTALMGVSGAGKTTLLDVLATRVTMGVISGEMLVDGRQRDRSFQRKTGYVQQQDLHLLTSTVREALNFSALLRQPADVPRQEKLDYVTEVIKLLDMEEYADAVVGVPGEGLNVEQRKRLTIGVELVAKPQLLLFLDEPTSGLDSQTSWSILNLLEKLTKNGQAILCTIHQPSAMLFQRFDRLLFLAKGGRTVYFGDIGESSKTLIEYFVKYGAHPCPSDANPAEWMLEVIGAAPGSQSEIDWPLVWRNSPELNAVHDELDKMRWGRQLESLASDDKADYREFAASLTVQFWQVQKRVFQQYWRTPSYIYSKLLLCIAPALFIGFSFYKASNTRQGLQNQMFSIFELMTLIPQLAQQTMPLFVAQRELFEVRERPGKTYSWLPFLISNVFVEVTWGVFCAILVYVCWYYPVGLWRNAEPTDSVTERGLLTFLLLLAFMLFTSTFAHMVIASISNTDTAGNISNLLFILNLIFCGVLASPNTFPGFWTFMYRLSPFHYLVGGLLSTAVKDTGIACANSEYLNFNPPLVKPAVHIWNDRSVNLEAIFKTLTRHPIARSVRLATPTSFWKRFLPILAKAG
ncbi:ABC-2 type transporter-domain-containing protein [Talaromyces proteolyticus]|uniref:ABC-2 type transporter-domain-containing protein n=1 Tax=Talaromyces proteolyticus TaxID=1131652 RepID=A0AAD4KS74_9EURO|nr:ABC-2 type transporter-domain-containing protein [Talaromyces proteolyticus]KAH8697976.1 ABC-2 type transporter-domain-containing protein [Talaromyces proteolyticus]